MWRLVLILSQIVICVISEDVIQVSDEVSPSNDQLVRLPLVHVQRPDGEQRSHSRARRALDDDDRIYLTNPNDISYGVQITMGYPNPQVFSVILDTGSDDLVMPLVRCITKDGCKNSNLSGKYDPSKSEEYQKIGGSYKVIYGDSNVLEGVMSKDRITIGNYSVKNQMFAEILDGSYYPYKSAIFGLKMGDPSKLSYSKLLENMKRQGLMKNRIFYVALNHYTDSTGGEIVFGGYDATQKIFWTPVTQPGWWQFKMSSIQVIKKKWKQNNILFTACNGGCETIMDTATTLISGPKNEVDEINKLIGAQEVQNSGQYYIKDCDRTDFPDIVMNVQSLQITLKPKDYFIRINGWCLSAFGIVENKPFKWIFGAAGHRAVVAIYDLQKKRIGFAPRKQTNN